MKNENNQVDETDPIKLIKENQPLALPLNDEEKRAIAHWEETNVKKTSKVRYNLQDANNLNAIYNTSRGSQEEKNKLMMAQISQATGASDAVLGGKFLSDCFKASGFANTDNARAESDILTVTNALHALKPADEFEGMIISRMVAIHFQIMDFMNRAIDRGAKMEHVDVNVNRVTKLTRLYNESLDTLMRYRRRGEQRLVVQHVNVENGGKAVVSGQFAAGGGGGI
jgi:hypothetical protein